MIQFDESICGNVGQAVRREWLETNGLGGFASSTIIGLNTRRYHGLLTAATKVPVGRMVVLSKLEETVLIGGRRFELSANKYPGVIHPQGYQYLKSFRLDPFPIFVYSIAGIEIEKTVFMVDGENTTVVQYEIRGDRSECVLELHPLIAFRDYHSTTHSNNALNPSVAIEPGLASVAPYQGLPALYFAHDAREMETAGSWYYNFEYPVERERGLDYREDLFNPFTARFNLDQRSRATVIASTQPHDVAQAAIFRQTEIARRAGVLQATPSENSLVRSLVTAADQFIVKRQPFHTIIAGYHWFCDWGRDAMISLPGLTLITGRFDVAKNILRAFGESIDQGMLPNRFPDAGEAPEYNTVDAALWFVEAVRCLLQYTGDYEFVRDEMYPKIAEILDWYVRGTRYNIHVDADGLVACGAEGIQLTWMDAKVDGWVVTPRHGKPVEIQALWYNALRVAEQLAQKFGDDAAARRYNDLAAQAKQTFNAVFWNEPAGCLYDVVSADARDGSIRPNQLFAISLAHPVLSSGKWQAVVNVVERELLTPYGLRTLARGDPQYRPRCEGDQRSRDAAYHKGTVWPWLMGPFLSAYVEASGHSLAAREQAHQWLRAFEPWMSEYGLAQIPEICDGDAPHQPRGCIAQAWSVAEILRATVEDVLGIRPA